MSVVGLDIGTSNIKALLAHWDGRIIDVQSVKTPVLSESAGQHGFLADQVYEAAAALVARIAGALPGDPVDTLVFSCLGTAMVPLDGSGRPLGAALSPADTRPWTGQALDERIHMSAESLRHLTGSDPRLASFLLHWLWWREAHPEVAARVARFRSLRGYLVQELCGEDAEDQSWASRTMLLDLETNAWSEAVLTAADLPADALPEILPSTTIWTVRRSAGVRFGLSADARVVLGGMDNCCSFLGAADSRQPRLTNIVGTFEHIAGTGDLGLTRSAAAAADGLVHSFVLPGQYISMTRETMGLLLSGLSQASSVRLDRLLDGVSARPTGRRTHLDLEAVRTALRDGTPPGVVLQGLLESAATVLLRFADAWDAAAEHRSDHIAAVGGGATRDNLLQLKANILGRSVSTLRSDEGAGLGALRLAAIARQGLSASAACELFPNPVVRTWSPIP